MKWIPVASVTQNKAAGTSRIGRIIFENFPAAQRRFHIGDGDSFGLAFVIGMSAELIVAAIDLPSDPDNFQNCILAKATRILILDLYAPDFVNYYH